MNHPKLLREILYSAQRDDFLSFVRMSFRELKGNVPFYNASYIEYTCDILSACRDERPQRLLFAMPPRHLKSFIMSVCLPAWLLGHHPSWKIILCSYAQDVAEEKGLECLKLMEGPNYRHVFPNTRISDEKRAAGDFVTTAGGGMYCTSIMGAITGKGADVLLIDDPIKVMDANVAHQLVKVERFYRESGITRLNHPEQGIVIINMQRLATNDLIGILKDTEGYKFYSFPIKAEQDEFYPLRNGKILMRKASELLNPGQYSTEFIEKRRKEMGESAFSAQYMQRPLMAQNVYLLPEYFPDYLELPLSVQQSPTIYISVDTANKTGENNDYTAIAIIMPDNVGWQANYYLQKVHRVKLAFDDLYNLIETLAKEWRTQGYVRLLIEDTGLGSGIIRKFQRAGKWPIIPCRPTEAKEVRVQKYMDIFSSKQIFLPQQAPWKREFLDELLSFPNGKNDDQVDALLQVVEFISNQRLCTADIA